MREPLHHLPSETTYAAQRLARLLRAAQNDGIGVRQEWLDGGGGGLCEFGGRRWLFVDLSLSVAEQLEQASEALLSAGSLKSASPAEASAPARPKGFARQAGREV